MQILLLDTTNGIRILILRGHDSMNRKEGTFALGGYATTILVILKCAIESGAF